MWTLQCWQLGKRGDEKGLTTTVFRLLLEFLLELTVLGILPVESPQEVEPIRAREAALLHVDQVQRFQGQGAKELCAPVNVPLYRDVAALR